MYRSATQSNVLQKVLNNRGIAHTVMKSTKLYDRKEVRDVCCFLQALSNPFDVVSLKRAFEVFNDSVKANTEVKRGPGLKTFEAFENWAAQGVKESDAEPSKLLLHYYNIHYFSIPHFTYSTFL